jgi:hypothetical protein
VRSEETFFTFVQVLYKDNSTVARVALSVNIGKVLHAERFRSKS